MNDCDFNYFQGTGTLNEKICNVSYLDHDQLNFEQELHSLHYTNWQFYPNSRLRLILHLTIDNQIPHFDGLLKKMKMFFSKEIKFPPQW